MLGSASALPVVGEYPTACVINSHEQFFLIDAGEGVQKQLIRYNIPLHKLNRILITHLHGDHVFGLFGLVSTMGLIKREQPLHIYAPAALQELMSSMGIFFDLLPYKIEYHPIDPCHAETIFENKTLTITTIPMQHSVPACGFLFKEKTPALNVSKAAIANHSLSLHEICAAKRGEDIVRADHTLPNSMLTYRPYTPRSIAYCTDTAYSDSIVEAVGGVDLLFHEATFSCTDSTRATQTGHSTATDAATTALKANVKRLIIGHFSSRYKGDNTALLEEARKIFPQTYCAAQGEVFDVKSHTFNPK